MQNNLASKDLDSEVQKYEMSLMAQEDCLSSSYIIKLALEQ